MTELVERLRAALPEVIDADERLSRAMLDNASCQIIDEADGLCSAVTTVLCNYNDLRIVLGFVDDAREAAALIEHQAETIARLTAEVEAFEGAFRIQVWNACRASNMKQDAAILAVEKAVVKVRAALTDGRN